MTTHSPETVAARFGCTVEQARALYLRNAAQLRQIADKCEEYEAAGKKRYSGYPATKAQAEALRAKAARFEAM